MVYEATFPENSYNPIAVLIDELRNDDVQNKLSSIRRISTIAIALGPDRTRSELIPFLTDNVFDDDEVLLVLAQQLGEFEYLIGGLEYLPCLLPPLKCLCQVEEILVRDKAVSSLCKLAPLFSVSDLEEHFAMMVLELSKAAWFSSRASASGLIAVCYNRVSSHVQSELRKAIEQLCLDEMPMVRRAIAFNLKDIIVLADEESVKTKFMPLYRVIAFDPQDSVRMLAPDAGIAIASATLDQDIRAIIIDTFKTMQTDKSWRVRYVIAEKLPKLAKNVYGADVCSMLVPILQNLLSDNEAEVRSAATAKINEFVMAVDEDERTAVAVHRLGPCLLSLARDCNQHVKVALAPVIMSLAPIAGKEKTIKFLLPIYLTQLKDECAEVRLNIISNLSAVNEVIGIQQLSESLMPAIIDLAEDPKWRIRLAIIEFIPSLAKQLGSEFFDEKLQNLCMSWLTDSVFAIREAATNNLASLTETFGDDWVQSTVVPKISELANDGNYLYRMTAIFSINVLASVVKPEVFQQQLLPILLNFANDNVPNLRFNLAQSLSKCQSYIPAKLIEEMIRPLLEKLLHDSDVDVRYFAEDSLQSINCPSGRQEVEQTAQI